MAPEAPERDASESFEPAPQNRQLSTEPVALSDGSEDAPKAPVDQATAAPAIAAAAAKKTVPSLKSAPARRHSARNPLGERNPLCLLLP